MDLKLALQKALSLNRRLVGVSSCYTNVYPLAPQAVMLITGQVFI